MASEKYLAVIGIGEEDTAHLRLLLRVAAGKLEHPWRWGTEDNADLLIIDPAELGGQIARNRAFSGGRRCAVFGTDEALRPGELRLAKPLKADDLVALLNASVAPSDSSQAPLLQQSDDFYGQGMFDAQFHLEEDTAAHARVQRGESAPALGLDELFKPDSQSAKPQFVVPGKLDADTRIERSRSLSARGEHRVADSIDGRRKPTDKLEGINIADASMGGAPGVGGKFPLRTYLTGVLLGGPATLCLDGAPAITLDPKEKVFHTAVKLRALSVYCQDGLARDAWRPVISQELARLRSEQPARPYALLIWLDVLLHAGGRLATHLDPGGRYKLKRWPEIEHEFTNHQRIATALLQPLKLNEVAAASGAPMADVFDAVTAWDAVGLIEVEGRIRRHAELESTGVLARLRNLFGKS